MHFSLKSSFNFALVKHRIFNLQNKLAGNNYNALSTSKQLVYFITFK